MRLAMKILVTARWVGMGCEQVRLVVPGVVLSSEKDFLRKCIAKTFVRVMTGQNECDNCSLLSFSRQTEGRLIVSE